MVSRSGVDGEYMDAGGPVDDGGRNLAGGLRGYIRCSRGTSYYD